MKLDTYHRYAAFFDAARALQPPQYIRLHGDEAGEAFREWATAHGIDLVEIENERLEGGRRVAWQSLEVPDWHIGVHLDDRCFDVQIDPPALQPELDIPI